MAHNWTRDSDWWLSKWTNVGDPAVYYRAPRAILDEVP